ncbi:urea transporter 1 [Cephus cinctus]|uniref:Urea transporter 1 n=1 Tax=Cephus cinctus TaxID=211228 RepID=A0AAJ7BWD6_CEPCN|nr:urea transporter 1 [Cephus cinctus]XP_024941141.1 urea transporter 1 [Cephus cinctus]
MLLLSVGTGLLGLLVSMLTNEQQATIGNGLTVHNPVLVGALTYNLIPKPYDPFDPFPLFLIFLGTVFSVYLARSIGNGRFPCLTWPVVVVEFLLLFVLTLNDHSPKVNSAISTRNLTDNATSDATMEYASHIVENGTVVNLNWGMVLQGAVTSASQVFALNDVAAGSVIYLALLIYSPAMAALSFIGASAGCLLGLLLGVPQQTVYDGIWGFNGVLTGSAMGGTFLVLNRQTVVATLIAVLFCPVLQFVLAPIAAKWGLPVLAAPFVLTVWLFLGLRESPGHTFPRPECMSFPEKQRYEFLKTRRALRSNRAEGSGEPETPTREEKRPSSTSCDLCT